MTRNGEIIALDDVDRMCAWLGSICENLEKLQKMIESVAMECLSYGMHSAAGAYLGRQLALLENPQDKATCLLKMGQVMEQANNFGKALEHYARAFNFPQENSLTWYFLNNNRGYCLNILGSHREGEEFCRAAIQIAPKVPNGWKNLGISLQGQGKIDEAALSYLEATERCPEDSRAFWLLEELLMANPDVLESHPVLAGRYRNCLDLIRTTSWGSHFGLH